MPTPLPIGFLNFPYTEYGKGPGRDTGAPIWSASGINPTPSNIISIINAANANNVTLILGLTGARDNWCDAVGDKLHFNRTKYQNLVRRFTVAGGASAASEAALRAALASRRALIYAVDEPFHTVFDGTITPSILNTDIGLYTRSIFSDSLVCVRTPSAEMNGHGGPPPGGYTGFDYGWAQWSGRGNSINLTPAQFYTQEKAAFLALNMGVIPGFNIYDQADARLWDVDLNGATPPLTVWGNASSQPGRQDLPGPNASHRFLASPAMLQEVSDVVFNDADAPCFIMWTYAYDSWNRTPVFRPYEIRSDFVAAYNYMINKLATRPTFNGFRTPKGILTPPPPPPSTAIGYIYNENVNRFTMASDAFVDMQNASGVLSRLVGFTAGHDYLIQITADIDINNATDVVYVRTKHGATAFPGSQMVWRRSTTGTRQYKFWTVWNAVGGEEVRIEWHRKAGGTATCGADQVVLSAIDLSTLPAGSVQYNQSIAATGLTVAFADGASKTFTPGTASHDWLILSLAQYTGVTNTTRVQSRQDVSGGTTATEPQDEAEGEDGTLDEVVLTTACARTLPASAHTFKERSAVSSGVAPSRQVSQILALDMNAFVAHAFTYDSTTIDVGLDDTTPYVTQVASKTFDFVTTMPVFILGSHAHKPGGSGVSQYSRMQMDNIDCPITQTSDHAKMNMPLDPSDVLTTQFQCLQTNLVGGSHVVDLDASTHTTGAGFGSRSRLIVALGLGTSSGGGGTPPVWDSIEDIDMNEGETLSLVVNATDADPITYSVVGSLPTGATFDSVTKRFVWTPNFDQAGSYLVTLRASDGVSTSDEVFTINVIDVPVSVDFKDLRNLRYDAEVQGSRLNVTISWNGAGDINAKQGLTGIQVQYLDTGRI